MKLSRFINHAIYQSICVSTIFFVRETLSLNPPPNNNAAPAVGNAMLTSSTQLPLNGKLGGPNAVNGQNNAGLPNNQNGNNANPNVNGLKSNNNGLQGGTPNNLPNANGNNGATNNQGASNNAGLPHGGNISPTAGNMNSGANNGNNFGNLVN